MSERISKNLPFLNLFCSNCQSKSRRRDLMKFANKEEINSICECIENFLSGNVADSGLKRKMRKYKSVLRMLRDRKKSIKKKKNSIVQHGGFLSALLVPLLSIASGLIGDAIARGNGG